MKWQPFSLLAALAMTGCTSENNDPIYGDLWSADLVSGTDGVYVRLPHAGKLIRLNDSGDIESVDLNGATPQQLVSVPDGSKTLAFAQWQECEDDDDSIVYVSDCDVNSSSIESIELEEPANKVLVANKSAVLYNDANDYVHDVYRIDLETSELIEYVAENLISSLKLNANGLKAVAIMQPEFGSQSYQDANWGLAIMDMGSNDIVNLIAESRPVGVEIIDAESGSYALVLLSGLDYVLKIDLNNPLNAEQIDLPAPPLSLGTMPDGRFIIAHDSRMGMVSTFDPAASSEAALTTVSGFAAVGLLNTNKLPRRGEEN
jgi:hypothetical protein